MNAVRAWRHGAARAIVVDLAVLALIAGALAIGHPSRAVAATCTSSVGPGIPAPTSVPSGIEGFHASWYGQSGYPTLCPGERSTAVVAYYNSGTRGWVSGRLGEMAFLGTWGPLPGQDQPSMLGGDGTNGSPATGWPRFNRVAAQPADYVGPNQVAWFQFTIQAPQEPGIYRLYIRPLVEGANWMEDFGVFWQVTVKFPEPGPSPSPTPSPSPASGIDVAPTGRATLATGATRTYTVSLSGASVCVDLAFIDARVPRADGSLRDVERDTAGNVVGDERADLSSAAVFTLINGAPANSSFIECVGGGSSNSITFAISSFTVNAFVRPIVFRDSDTDRKLLVDPLDRPAEPTGIGGAVRFLPPSAPQGAQKVIVQSVAVDERIFVDVGQYFRWDDNDAFLYGGSTISRTQFEQVLSSGDSVSVSYRIDPTQTSTFDVTSDSGNTAPSMATVFGSFHGTGVMSDVRLTLTEPASNADGVMFAIARATVAGGPTSCGAGSGTYAQIATITVPIDADVTTFDDHDVGSGTFCYSVTPVVPLGTPPPSTFGPIVVIPQPPPTVFSPASLEARLVAMSGSATAFDAGDSFKIAFTEPVRVPANGAYIRVRDADGTIADFICGTNVACNTNDSSELLAGTSYAPGSVLTVVLTADLKIVGDGSVAGVQIGATVIGTAGIADANGRDWSLSSSNDVVINYPPAR